MITLFPSRFARIALRRPPLLAGLAVLFASLIAGCTSPPTNDVSRVGPFYVPRNVHGDPTLGGVRRVLLMPIWAGELVPDESAADLDPVFRQALQDQNRFEVVTMARDECRRRFGATALSSTQALPHDLIATVQRLYAADAIMFVDLTTFRPYRPIAIGIRARLVIVNNLHFAWSFDNLFSVDDPEVAASARHFFVNSMRQEVPGDLTPAVLQSPSRFAAYAANATFLTLPPVTLAKIPSR